MWDNFITVKNKSKEYITTSVTKSFYSSHTGRSIVHDLDQLQNHIYIKSKALNDDKVQKKDDLCKHKCKIKDAINDLISDWKNQVKERIAQKIDVIVSTAFKNEVEDTLPNLIYDFHDPLVNQDPQMIKIYKKNLLSHIEVAFIDCLKSKLSIELFFIEQKQRTIFKNSIEALLVTEKQETPSGLLIDAG